MTRTKCGLGRWLGAAFLLIGVWGVGGAETQPRWSLEGEGGYLLPQSNTFGYAKKQTVAWGALGYRLNRWVQLGWEGGHVFDRTETSTWEPVPGYQLQESRRMSATYTGPYAQAQWLTRFVQSSLRAGAGVAMSDIDFESNVLYSSADALFTTHSRYEYNVADPAITLAAALDWRCLPRLLIGVGVRDLILIRHEAVYENVGTDFSSENRTRFRHLLMPFARLSFLF